MINCLQLSPGIQCFPSRSESNNATLNCSDENYYESTCNITCHQYYGMRNTSTIISRCELDDNLDAIGSWSVRRPKCLSNCFAVLNYCRRFKGVLDLDKAVASNLKNMSTQSIVYHTVLLHLLYGVCKC